MNEIWAVYAATRAIGEQLAAELDAPEGVTVMIFTPQGPPKYGHRFEKLYIVPPLISPRYWHEVLGTLRLGLGPNGEEILRTPS